jgi:hypothetical protein
MKSRRGILEEGDLCQMGRPLGTLSATFRVAALKILVNCSRCLERGRFMSARHRLNEKKLTREREGASMNVDANDLRFVDFERARGCIRVSWHNLRRSSLHITGSRMRLTPCCAPPQPRKAPRPTQKNWCSRERVGLCSETVLLPHALKNGFALTQSCGLRGVFVS